ncbi:dnaJ homolog subfamily C member 16-like [Haliotis rufescens]|uniref:dnaJ homolog subfamily C member 16-like n=1 Tax=Haliotis rufescens TaxID=6454 RepID=UPI00201E973E|nr:dnaJ homolog subfamily C member 16-like [Haliotis rufescens]
MKSVTMNSVAVLSVIACFIVVTYCYDLYETLGVGKGASSQEIRKAYKKMAREWHPDKNDAPNAADVFTKINEAYETLSDPEKRSTYDNYGYTSASNNEGRNHNFRQQGFAPFDNFFGGGGGGGGFRFSFGGDSIIEKHRITLRNFETKVVPESFTRPCFMYVYTSFCFDCLRIEPYIEKIIMELQSVGLCVGAVHDMHSQGVVSHLRISHAPAILGIVNGRPVHYKGGISMNMLREFVRGWFPKNTLHTVNDKNYDEFLSGWADNRVRAIFFSQKDQPSARFLAPAYYYREYVKSGYVNTHSPGAARIMKMFGVNHNRETLLMFNEEVSSPVASVAMQQLPRKTLDEVIESNKFLLLPRLSSQKFLDTLCPAEPKLKRRKFCVVLVTKQSVDHDPHRVSFRNFAQSKKFSDDKVKFVYIYEDTQHKFISTLTKGNVTRKESTVEVAIMWRMDSQKLNYEFLESGWSINSERVGASREQLEARLHTLLTSDRLLPYKAIFTELYNEHALSLLTRIFHKLFDWADRLFFFAFSYDGMTLMTVMFAVLFVILAGYSMQKLASVEHDKVKRQMDAKKRNMRPPSSTPDNQTIHLYDLRFETYKNLVAEADTGLTIVIFVNETSKEQMLTRFAQIMQPYSRYSALTFAYLQLEYYISWYQHLLELSLNFKVKLNNININSCVGTVLAINGYRKYYYIFHPKKARQWMKEHNNLSRAIGFLDDDSDSDKEQDNMDFSKKYLSGLAMWMDRIFDGSAVKVRLDYWPEMCS